MANVNPGPASASNTPSQTPYAFNVFIQTIAVAITPVAVTTATTAAQSYGANGASFATVATGIQPGDVVLNVNPPSITAGTGIVGFYVDTATADKFYVVWANTTAGSLTPAAGTYLVTVARFNQAVTTTPAVLTSLPNSLQ